MGFFGGEVQQFQGLSYTSLESLALHGSIFSSVAFRVRAVNKKNGKILVWVNTTVTLLTEKWCIRNDWLLLFMHHITNAKGLFIIVALAKLHPLKMWGCKCAGNAHTSAGKTDTAHRAQTEKGKTGLRIHMSVVTGDETWVGMSGRWK